jgi:hypothetical protein
MQIDLDLSEHTIKTAIMRHGEEIILWDVQAFNRKNFETDFQMFSHSNAFWATLSEKEQQQAFEIFRKIKFCLEDNARREQKDKDLAHLIAELYQFHSLAKLGRWVKIDSDIKFPQWLQSEYDPTREHHVSRNQTYTLPDYVQLIVFAFALRMMIPIWSEYIGRTKHDTKTSLKEYHAYKLLRHSELYTCEAMEKLRTYTQCAIPPEKPKSAIIGGLSSAEFPSWILAVALIRKICIGDIRGVFPEPQRLTSGKIIEPPTLVTYIFNHIVERVRHHPNNFVGLVKDKVPQEGENNVNSDQQASRLEGYKIKMDVPAGRIVMLIKAGEEYHKSAQLLAPGIDPNLVEDAVRRRMASDGPILDSQVTLLQWLYKPVIPPRGIYHLNKQLIKQNLGTAEAVLWHHGFHTLAALVSADVYESDNGIQIAGTDSRARIPKELGDELLKYYPYARKSASRSKTTRTINQAQVSIDLLLNQLSQVDYNLILPEQYLPGLTGNSRSRRFSTPHDLGVMLVQFAIFLAKRSEAAYHRYNSQLAKD